MWRWFVARTRADLKAELLAQAETMNIKDPAIRWLLQCGEPSIRYLTLTELLGKTH